MPRLPRSTTGATATRERKARTRNPATGAESAAQEPLVGSQRTFRSCATSQARHAGTSSGAIDKATSAPAAQAGSPRAGRPRGAVGAASWACSLSPSGAAPSAPPVPCVLPRPPREPTQDRGIDPEERRAVRHGGSVPGAEAALRRALRGLMSSGGADTDQRARRRAADPGGVLITPRGS